jgi:hypothetical protein
VSGGADAGDDLGEYIRKELIGLVVNSGDAIHTPVGEMMRLSADAPGDLIVEGRPFGLRMPRTERDVTVVAAGALGPGTRVLVALVRTPEDDQEMRRRVNAEAFSGPRRVRYGVDSVSSVGVMISEPSQEQEKHELKLGGFFDGR